MTERFQFPLTWNSLPSTVTAAPTLSSFRRTLKTHLFTVSFPSWHTICHSSRLGSSMTVLGDLAVFFKLYVTLICSFYTVRLFVRRQLRTRATFSQSRMVSVGVWKLNAPSELIFLEPRAKINGQYYRAVVRRTYATTLQRTHSL